MGAIKTGPSDFSYTAAIDFQDSILQYALNAAYPGRFNYCTMTNSARNSTDFSILFYNQQKLGFIGITCHYVNTTDFNTYKFYYKDPNLGTTHDTTYLYVTLNHDISGSGNESQRGAQIAGEMAQIGTHFTHLANMINMGDFNLRYSTEPVYQTLTAPADTNFRYFDPPYYPDAVLTYPSNWDASPSSFAAYLTTSTRQSASVPNSCGTSGGGKNWYDHILLSRWIASGLNYISYIPHSYRTIGNDGNRTGISINDAPTNTSAPPAVINALFQMSNKYPVMLDLLVTPNTTGVSLVDPEVTPSSVTAVEQGEERVTIVDPVGTAIILHISDDLIGKKISIDCTDMLGRSHIHELIVAGNGTLQVPCSLAPGIYAVKIASDNGIICRTIITKY
jgi:hypothetical protein